MYAFNYNRQKFANLAKCDAKQSIPSTAKAIKRPLPVPPPVPPTQPPKPSHDPCADIQSQTPEQTVTSNNDEQKLKKRKTKSSERLRDQSNDIELSDSDEDIAVVAQPIPIIITDEPDASVTSPSLSQCLSEAANAISNTTVDEPAICADSLALDANTFSNRSQISFDEILKIEESFDEDGGDGPLNQSIIVDIHTEPTIELRIHESDSDPTIATSDSMHGILNASKLAKEQTHYELERERCFSESDALDQDDDVDDIEKSERLVQSDSEILSKTPLELVVECDINENVIVNETKSSESTDLDHNHNDIVKSTENDQVTHNEHALNESAHTKTENGHSELVQNRESTPIVSAIEQRRESISSRSSCSECDSNEPVYATVDTTLNTVSFSSLTTTHFSKFVRDKREQKGTKINISFSFGIY